MRNNNYNIRISLTEIDKRLTDEIRKMVTAITNKTSDLTIDFRNYSHLDIDLSIRAWVNERKNRKATSACYGLCNVITEVTRTEDIGVIIEDMDYFFVGEIYDLPIETLVEIHNNLEKIYNYVFNVDDAA